MANTHPNLEGLDVRAYSEQMAKREEAKGLDSALIKAEKQFGSLAVEWSGCEVNEVIPSETHDAIVKMALGLGNLAGILREVNKPRWN